MMRLFLSQERPESEDDEIFLNLKRIEHPSKMSQRYMNRIV